MKILKRDIEDKIKELRKILPSIDIHIDGRRRSVYINGVRFTYPEILELDINKLKHPSFWGV